MEKNRKLLILGVVLLFGAYYLYKNRKDKTNTIMTNDVSYDTKEVKNNKNSK